MIATYITNKTVSGNLLILKTFTLIAIPVRLLGVSLCRFTKTLHNFSLESNIKKKPTRFFSALYRDYLETIGLLKNKNHFELKLAKGDHNVLVDGSQETRRFFRIENYCYLLVANFISFNLIWG